jgi:ADP-ribose pyrophosphatase YjhB (NUDIX family)
MIPLPDPTPVFPQPFRLAVKAVVIDDANRCLLLRRSAANKNFVGCWEWPGGKVDPGEDFASAKPPKRRASRSNSPGWPA